MDWLKDKKNQPIIAAILAVVIVGACVLVYFTMFSGGPSAPDMPAEQTPGTDPNAAQTGAVSPTSPAPGTTPMPGTAPAPPGTAAAPAGMPGGQPAPGGAAVAATPIATWRDDPFLPVGYKPKTGPKPKPRIFDFPYIHLPPPPKPLPPKLRVEAQQPIRRLAGVMLNGRVFAIIESNGKSEIVQPGQPLPDGLATVERIEADKVILKTIGDAPRYLVVRLAKAASRPASASGGGAPSDAPASGTRPSIVGPPRGLGMPGGRPVRSGGGT